MTTASEILQLDEPNFVTFLMLRRPKYQHDSWFELSEFTGIIAHIASCKEFIEKNPAFATPSLIHPEHDMVTEYSTELIERAFVLFVDRPPTEEEFDFLRIDPGLSLGALCSRLCWDPAFLRKRYSPVVPGWSKADYARDIGVYASFLTQDCFNRAGLEKLQRGGTIVRRLETLRSRPLNVDVAIYDDVAADKSLLVEALKKALHRADVEINFRTESDIATNGFAHSTSMYVTNNNFLYRSLPAISAVLSERQDIISACWLFDNHHQFEVNNRICDAFDFVFPAHTTGQTYLSGGKAIAGPIVPCAVIQWSTAQIKEYYAGSRERSRSNELYGRFSSYLGRTLARDRFLEVAARTIAGNSIQLIRYDKQDWFEKGSLGRFLDFADRKVSVSTPIFNDVPIRIFDALAAGQIPLVPFGVPGFEIAVPREAQRALPIVTYFYDDIDSLEQAYRRALDLFDCEGQIGADRRHIYAVSTHMGHHRITDMISWIMEWPGGPV